MATKVGPRDLPLTRGMVKRLDAELEHHYLDVETGDCACRVEIDGDQNKLLRHFIEVGYLLGRQEVR